MFSDCLSVRPSVQPPNLCERGIYGTLGRNSYNFGRTFQLESMMNVLVFGGQRSMQERQECIQGISSNLPQLTSWTS